MNQRSTTHQIPGTVKPHPQCRVRKYRFEVDGVELWAVPALIQMIQDQAAKHSGGRLERVARETICSFAWYCVAPEGDSTETTWRRREREDTEPS
jgi:hypothetical protein